MNDLSTKYKVHPRTVYKDFESKKKWQPELTELKDNQEVLLKIINRYEQIYRAASFVQFNTKNESARLGAFRIMMEATRRLCEVAVLLEFMDRLKALEEKAEKGVFVP